MKRVALISIAIFAALLAVYLFTSRAGSPVAPFAVSPPVAPYPAAAKKVVAPTPAPNVAAKFTRFLAEESKQLESMHVDAAAMEARENEIAGEMGEPEVNYARELALSREAPANQRILAMDLLGRASSRLTGPALDEIITRGMNSARAEPHTVDELSNVQAKSFALMGVDAIADKAVHDRGERDHLERLAASATDTTIKKHIEERLHDLPPI